MTDTDYSDVIFKSETDEDREDQSEKMATADVEIGWDCRETKDGEEK